MAPPRGEEARKAPAGGGVHRLLANTWTAAARRTRVFGRPRRREPSRQLGPCEVSLKGPTPAVSLGKTRARRTAGGGPDACHAPSTRVNQPRTAAAAFPWWSAGSPARKGEQPRSGGRTKRARLGRREREPVRCGQRVIARQARFVDPLNENARDHEQQGSVHARLKTRQPPAKFRSSSA